MTFLKIRVDEANCQHVKVTLFAGENRAAMLANIGSLCMTVGAYQIIAVAISMGAERTNRHLVVEYDDEKFVKFIESNPLITEGFP